MPVFRVEKSSNYTVISNYHLKEKNMSLKAKGLMTIMLSLPENWDYSIEGLVKLSSDGETAIRSTLKELEEFHYLRRKPIRENGKIIDWQYCIFEKPEDSLDVENPQVENLEVENHVQLNTKQLNTNKQNTNSIFIKNKNTVNSQNQGFLGSINRQQKNNLYQNHLSLIRNFTMDEDIRKSLINFLDLQLEIYNEKGKTFYTTIMKNRLNKLKTDFKPEEWKMVIDYSVSKGWGNFFPIPVYDNQSSVGKNESYYDANYTQQEKQWQEDMEKNGKITKF